MGSEEVRWAFCLPKEIEGTQGSERLNRLPRPVSHRNGVAYLAMAYSGRDNLWGSQILFPPRSGCVPIQ